jgi:hypothetical protein
MCVIIKQPQYKHGDDEHWQGGCVAGQQGRTGKNNCHQSCHAMRRNKVHQAANNGKTKRTGQRSEHIQPPKFTVAQAKGSLPL